MNTSVLSFWTVSFEVVLYYFWEFLYLEMYAFLCGQKLYKASAQLRVAVLSGSQNHPVSGMAFKNFRNKKGSSSFPQRLVPTAIIILGYP